jgi:pimeloyl-ACP methyl ester carboxylesterase
MVQEISKFVPTAKIVLISTVKKRGELPLIYRISSALSLHKFIPRFFFHNRAILGTFLLGKYRKDAMNLFDKYMTINNTAYSRWAIDKVVNWKDKKLDVPFLHIHGTNDGVFPKKYIKNAIFIDRGTHLMIHTKATKISKLINEFFGSE